MWIRLFFLLQSLYFILFQSVAGQQIKGRLPSGSKTAVGILSKCWRTIRIHQTLSKPLIGAPLHGFDKHAAIINLKGGHGQSILPQSSHRRCRCTGGCDWQSPWIVEPSAGPAYFHENVCFQGRKRWCHEARSEKEKKGSITGIVLLLSRRRCLWLRGRGLLLQWLQHDRV